MIFFLRKIAVDYFKKKFSSCCFSEVDLKESFLLILLILTIDSHEKNYNVNRNKQSLSLLNDNITYSVIINFKILYFSFIFINYISNF